jgi:ribosomal protein L19
MCFPGFQSFAAFTFNLYRYTGGSFVLRSVLANVPIERHFPTYSPLIKVGKYV